MTPNIYVGLNIPFRSQVIKSFYKNQEDTAKAIIKIVCKHFGIDTKEIMNQSRKHELVICRQISILFIKDKTTLTLKAIGSLFDGRDHSTVVHSLNTVQDLIDTDRRFAATVVAIGKLLEHIKLTDQTENEIPTVGSN